MCGKTRHGDHLYYTCVPQKAEPGGQARSLWAAERALLVGIDAFFVERVFGPNRAALLAEQLAEKSDAAALDRDQGLCDHRLSTVALIKQQLLHQSIYVRRDAVVFQCTAHETALRFEPDSRKRQLGYESFCVLGQFH
jgi:hypothetical protein